MHQVPVLPLLPRCRSKKTISMVEPWTVARPSSVTYQPLGKSQLNLAWLQANVRRQKVHSMGACSAFLPQFSDTPFSLTFPHEGLTSHT